jgi:predicted kinase
MANEKPTVLILQGLPASGKTTFAKRLQKDEPGKWKRVNRDELRAMLDDSYFKKGMEEFTLAVRNAIISLCLREGKNVIVDDTNLNPKISEQLKRFIGERADVELKFFDVSVKECIKWDKARAKPVGEAAIRKMAKDFMRLKDKFSNPITE